jgi:dTDP-4-dehydrorhamnose 3,5-epimerase
MTNSHELPSGVQLRALTPHRDARGSFTEIFRSEWRLPEPVQWNAVSSEPGTLRGVHVHLVHEDYLTLVHGRMVLGLSDLRPASPTVGRATVLELSRKNSFGVTIPRGVAHGFYFLEPSVHVYAVTHYWDPSDELGCRWDDPALGIPWPASPELLSPRDATAPGFEVMKAAVVDAFGAAA